jgi:hypothetical protein
MTRLFSFPYWRTSLFALLIALAFNPALLAGGDPTCATLEGTVTFKSTSKAVADGTVHAWRISDGILGSIGFKSTVHTSAIVNGAFSMSVPQGTYVISAHATGEASFETTWHAADSIAALAAATAERVIIPCAVTKTIDLVVKGSAKADTITITGTVVDAETKAGLNAEVTFTAVSSRLVSLNNDTIAVGPTRFTATTEADGSFSIKLPEGRYTAEADAALNAGVRYRAQFYNGKNDGLCATIIAVGEVEASIDFELEKIDVHRDTVGSIAGRLLLDLTTAVDATVSCYRVDSLVRGTVSAAASIATDAYGSFTLDGLKPGEYVLCIKPDMSTIVGGYVTAALDVAASWKEAMRIIVEADGSANVNVRLKKAAHTEGFARIVGTVRASIGAAITAVQGAVVSCADSTGKTVASVFTDAQGSFEISLLASGTFLVTVDKVGCEPETESVTTDPNTFSSERQFVLTPTTSVQDTENDVVGLTLMPNPASDNVTVVVTGHSSPLMLTVVDNTGRTILSHIVSERDGDRVHLPLLAPPGAYTLLASSPTRQNAARLIVRP